MDHTVKNVKLLCVLASQTGLKHVQEEYPELEVSLLIYKFILSPDEDMIRSGLLESTITSLTRAL